MHNDFFRHFYGSLNQGDKSNEDISYLLCELGSLWKQFNRVGTMKE